MGPKKDSGSKNGGAGNAAVWEEVLKTMKQQAAKLEAPVMAFNPILKIATDALEGSGQVPKRLIFASPIEPLWTRVLMYTLAIQCKTFANLQSLNFWNCNLGHKGAQYICSALHMLPNISILYMTDCGLGPEAMEYVSEMLYAKNAGYSLLILNIDHNKIGDEGASVSVCMYMCMCA
jgi:hypothetical protein